MIEDKEESFAEVSGGRTMTLYSLIIAQDRAAHKIIKPTLSYHLIEAAITHGVFKNSRASAFIKLPQ